jgi:hypothetical protein
MQTCTYTDFQSILNTTFNTSLVMSTTVTLTEPTQSSTRDTTSDLGGPNALRLDGQDPKYGDFRDDLARDGYAVVKGAVPLERAIQYANDMYSWLEGL